MSNKSNVDVAFDIVSKSENPVSFKELWDQVIEIQGLSESEALVKVGAFYTSLLLDGRFINLGDNTWDLRSRYTFEKATLDTNDCYTDEDDDEVELDPEEKEDEEEEDETKSESDDDSDDESNKEDYEG